MNTKIKSAMTSLLLMPFVCLAGEFNVEKDILFKTVGEREIKLDLYAPSVESNTQYPLLVWVHGGAWKRGSKDAIPEKNPLLLQSVLNEGYALASVDYRLSGEAIFPQPVQDINDALNYLYDNAEKLGIKADNVVIMGRSAGGHLAGFIGATNSAYHQVDFYEPPKYKVSAVVSFFGPTDLLELSNKGGKKTSKKSSVSRFLGDIPNNIPKLAKKASTTSYVNENTPPYIQLHGTLDKRVPLSQSEILKAKLDEHGVTNQLFIEEGVGHSAPVFDTEKYVTHVLDFLNKHFPN
ncbi:TPA: alpha/beta hydrolase [Vibrio alginolyticus]|uniref:alpha/beta hydrolase n=1 Tax=Vibrio TaxID=662 RepID=UPI00050512F7|nr:MULTISPECIES: alpha/beta hydrolase [Vibrio]EGQ7904542.1 alpha/beta hydrolase [Vibrio alginolyticus]EGQ8498771.1 alpha/beta hydrolase fold domain-containing protein [Vibrio alginolyticus]EGQ9112518.1 alpha/beta hydrolase fold domain-containing protein [Vibrio alginolyticus]EHA1100002.1 alpha/beta hydrolase [Vibrio alginolyticus]EHA1122309.1 alpha/beta hydrolase [Vibrio alginolyticus]